MSYWNYGYGYYTPTKPKDVKDGIKLQSGKIGSTWWSKKWISALESFSNTSRLQRGRRYARRGQVMNFKINSDGTVTGKVQGSAARPYSISVKIETFRSSDWNKILKEMGNQALFLAKLINGEMPEDIDEAFSAAGVSLFPKSRSQIKTHCSCPDWENPCKHIAAVHYVLGEEFDRDPFMIFKLRGMPEEQVIAKLRALRCLDALPEEEELPPDEEEDYETISLNECLPDFWLLGDNFNKINVSITQPTVPLAILKRLGAPGFWQDDDFWQDMEKLYKLMTDSAIKESYAQGDEWMRQESETGKNLNNIILHGTWIPGDMKGAGNGRNKFFLWGEKVKYLLLKK